MSVVPSQAKSRPTTPHQQQPNQAEGANGMGAGPQPHLRIPTDNATLSLRCYRPTTLATANDEGDPSVKNGQDKGKRKPA